MMNYCIVAKLNNEAIALFHNGKHEDAIMGLKLTIYKVFGNMKNLPVTATRTTSPSLTMPRENKQLQDESMHGFCHSTPAEQTSKSLHSEIMLPVHVKQPATSMETHVTQSIYNYVIVLSESYNELFSELYVARASVALFYNLAFIHHWQSIHCGLSSAMPKALQLYSMALKLISPEGNLSDIDCLAMAIWNNMGHVYSQLFSLNEARVCFDRLSYLLSSRPGLRCCMPKRDYEIFLLSAMLQTGELLLAPAA